MHTKRLDWTDEDIRQAINDCDFRHYEEDTVEELMHRMRDDLQAKINGLQAGSPGRITVVLQVPDNQEDAHKLLALLRHAHNQIDNYAKEQVQKHHQFMEELDDALDHPRPDSYRERIADHYRVGMAWNEARTKAHDMIWAAVHSILELLEQRKATASDHHSRS